MSRALAILLGLALAAPALAQQACPPQQVMSGLNADGTIACRQVTQGDLAPYTSTTSSSQVTLTPNTAFVMVLDNGGLGFAVGNTAFVQSTEAPENWARAVVTGNDGNGGLTFAPSTINGGGNPFTSWTVSLTDPAAPNFPVAPGITMWMIE
jgi:hypothetical protein